MSDKEKKEAEEQTEEGAPLLFLPFPFTTEAVKQPPYKGSDPEWAQFVVVNKDTKLQERIKCTQVFVRSSLLLFWLTFLLLMFIVQLADLIRKNIEMNPAYQRFLGSRSISIQKYWLDIIYPSSPPPVHYVSG